mmetsp:Transcript_100905/g.245350  ORF Transcript_100905/g.245350 Transcript_100905/m.245350 type:complete len:265 (-) Transcript_100905:670-1464(-)
MWASALACGLSALCRGGANDGAVQELPPGGRLCNGCGNSAVLVMAPCRNQQEHGLPEPLHEALQLRICRGPFAPSLRQTEAHGQQALQQPRARLRRPGREAQAHQPRKHQEELRVSVLAHRGQRGRDPLRRSDLLDEVGDRRQNGGLAHVARPDFPALLPVHEQSHKASVVAQVGIDLLEALANLFDVLAHRLEGANHVGCEHASSARRLAWAVAIQHGGSADEDVASKVIATLPAAVCHGVQARDAADEACPRLLVRLSGCAN